MILTEEEAARCRCPESYGPFYVTRNGGETHQPVLTQAVPVSFSAGAGMASMASQVPGHPFPTVASPGYCIGSHCMAWRWHSWVEYTRNPAGEFVPEPTVSNTHGYCGKAGTPRGYGKL